MNRTCPHCGKGNRVPAKHAADTGRCGSCKRELPPPAEPIEADTAQFTELLRDARVPILVDFWAPWCGPCKMAAPEVARAAAGLTGKAIVVKVNTDENPGLATQYAVRSIPTFAVFRGGSLHWRQSGVLGHKQLEQAVLAPG